MAIKNSVFGKTFWLLVKIEKFIQKAKFWKQLVIKIIANPGIVYSIYW